MNPITLSFHYTLTHTSSRIVDFTLFPVTGQRIIIMSSLKISGSTSKEILPSDAVNYFCALAISEFAKTSYCKVTEIRVLCVYLRL